MIEGPPIADTSRHRRAVGQVLRHAGRLATSVSTMRREILMRLVAVRKNLTMRNSPLILSEFACRCYYSDPAAAPIVLSSFGLRPGLPSLRNKPHASRR